MQLGYFDTRREWRTQVAIPVIEPSVTPDNNVTPVAPPEDTNTTPPVAAEKPKENKEAKKAAKAAKKAAKEAKKAAKKAAKEAKKRRGGKGKN